VYGANVTSCASGDFTDGQRALLRHGLQKRPAFRSQYLPQQVGGSERDKFTLLLAGEGGFGSTLCLVI
jgi:hypothetical protein